MCIRDSIKVDGNDILIDAGPKSESKHLLEQLKEFNIDDFEYVFVSHAHEDHIGGMPLVFQNYKVENFYMPKHTSTTNIYKSMIQEVKNQNLKITTIKAGDVINIGENAKFDIYSPVNSEYKDINNYSPIMKLTYGNTSYMFTGDAEALSEKEVLSTKVDLKADVLKVGHHGSNSSTSREFLESVSPDSAIISYGEGNDYGHPHKETVDKLKEFGVDVYYTAKDGQVTLKSDGNSFSISKEK